VKKKQALTEIIKIIKYNLEKKVLINEKRNSDGQDCFRYLDKRTDEKWTNQTGGQAKVNKYFENKFAKNITIYDMRWWVENNIYSLNAKGYWWTRHKIVEIKHVL
jgi:hypothetical protein